MNAGATPGMSARAIRDFGQALREDTFRVALALSLLAHVVLLVAFGRGGLGRTEEKRIPLMRVRILQSAPGQAAAPAGVRPEAPSAPREGLEQATAPVPPAPQPAAPAPASPAVREPAPAPAAVPAPAPPPRPQAETAPAPAPAVAPEAATTPASPPDLGAALHPAAAAGGEGGEGAAPLSPPASAAAGTSEPGAGTGPPRAALAAREGEASGNVGEGGSVGVGAVAAASGGTTPGPYDIAAVRRRIDARKVYPRIAVRNGWQGRVLVEMHLEGDGRLAAVRLLEGSGYAVLDEATLTAVRLASPFPPVARVLTVPVEYRLVP